MVKIKNILMTVSVLLFLFQCTSDKKGEINKMNREYNDLKKEVAKGTHKQAIFAGGCFWCMEKDFEKVPGVLSVVSGYIGGHVENPTYSQVSSGISGHAEAVEVIYNPKVVDYDTLLSLFWKNIDPTVKDKQFCDTGSQYRSEIFYINDDQRKRAEVSKKKVEKVLTLKIFTRITKATTFYKAEEYHQDFYKKNPIRYQSYRNGCGRDKRLLEIWGRVGDF